MNTRTAAPVPNDFRCRQCGNCCRPRGYVRLGPDEIEPVARVLGLSSAEFSARYTRLTDDRRGLSLVERPDGSCVFLESDNTCRIQAAKPRQCRSFPYRWRYEGWERICEGCKDERDSGPHHPDAERP